MTAKTHKIKQLLLAAASLTACFLTSVSVLLPTDVSAATKATYALSCEQGKVEVKKNKVACSKGSDTVTIQGVGSKADAAKNNNPYPTTIDLSIVSVDCGSSSPTKVQLGDTIKEFKCEKGTPKSVKITDTIDANTKAKTKVQVYSIDQSGETTGGNLRAKDSNCKPTDGNCADCQNTENGTPEGCPGCENGKCVDQAADPNAICNKANGCDLVAKYVQPAINLFSVSFGLIAVISLIVAGIQYSASTGDPQAVSKAKDRIIKTIFAIVAYFFLYALLQFLIPGGVFNRTV
ncbi:MAG: hypothetical protein JWO35_74 [Candidatus Saccharibacteria bacterium]|nr:hypothetical protein [Candidatus Saccharibacteria bacterium]